MRYINVLQFICPAGFYGAERWILALAKNLDRDKINCHLAVTHESPNQNIDIFYRFKLLGLSAHKIKMQGRFDPQVIKALSKLVKDQNVDIIHTHGYKSDIVGLLAARLSRAKVISTPHGFENTDNFKLQFFIKLGIMSLRFFDQVVPLSEGIKTDLCNVGIKHNRIQLITNGVDLDELRNGWHEDAQEPTISNQPRTIGYVGQLASRKNVIDIIKTFDLFYKEYQDIQLIIIGDGPQRKELELYAKSLACFNKIKFLGYREDRIRIMKTFDLFCMTSSLEGIPRAMMEAMALGIPTAAYRIDGISDLIKHNVTGLLVDFGDCGNLKNSWRKILFDNEFAMMISRNGKNQILKHYSAQRMAAKYYDLYNRMVFNTEVF